MATTTTEAVIAPPAAGQRISWPTLDGIRAVACVAVLGTHLGVLPGGYLGVDMFFVLSGYLITRLLLAEHDRAGRIRLRWFWVRRALRILPALGCVLAVSLPLAWLLAATAGQPGRALGADTIASAPWTAGFAANWVYALGIIHAGGMLLPAWSLAIEEQFYLAWPLILAWLLRREVNRARTALVLAGAAAAVMAWRAVVLAGWGLSRAWYGSDTRCDGLLAGCALAFFLATRPRVSPRLARAGASLGAAALVVLFCAGSKPGIAWQIPAAVAAATLIIGAVATGTLPAPLTRFLCSRPASWTGQRSYGLYLWQYPVLKAVSAGWLSWGRHLPAAVSLGLLAAAVVACFGLAAASYRLAEQPALRAARRYR